jgi:putative solute:sodium symporter small subunit
MPENRRAHRTTVTHPRTIAVRRPGYSPHAGAAEDVVPLSPVELLAVTALMRAQLRLSIRYLAATACVLIGVPLLLVHVAWLSTTTVFGVPLSWVLVGVGFFPLFIVIGAHYTRSVERLEERFVVLSSGNQ